MATFGRGAPVPERRRSALVEDPQFQEVVQMSRSLTERILKSIPDVHRSSIRSQALQLNSLENAKLARMALTIGIRSAPQLSVVSENVPLETSLRIMSEGLRLHQALLKYVSPRLEKRDKVTELLVEIRDLVFRINKMLRMVQGEALVQPTPTPVTLNLPGDYEVQVAAHLTLVQLQSFGNDMVVYLKSLDQSLDQSNEEETES